jgi:hypothetical protein
MGFFEYTLVRFELYIVTINKEKSWMVDPYIFFN